MLYYTFQVLVQHSISATPAIPFLLAFYKVIDLTDYSFLPNSLVSILTNLRITSADGNHIPMFSESQMFLDDLRLNNKVVIWLHCLQTRVSV